MKGTLVNGYGISSAAWSAEMMNAPHEGAEIKTHTAPGVIGVQVLGGYLGFEAEGPIMELKPGLLLTLQTNLPHSMVARQESVFLLIMANPAAEK